MTTTCASYDFTDLTRTLGKLDIVAVHNIGLSSTPVFPLAEILTRYCKSFAHLQHQISGGSNSSHANLYREGKLRKQIKIGGPSLAAALCYFLTIPKTFLLFLALSTRFNYYIAGDELNALIGVVLRKLGIAKTVIFYSIDYFPIRFSNPLLNGIFRWIEMLAVRNSNFIWTVSSRMEKVRMTQGANRVIEAPGMGADLVALPNASVETRKTHQLVYVGALTYEKGLDLVIKSLPTLVQKFPRIILVIVGDGPHKAILQETAKNLHVEELVQFKGKLLRSDLDRTLFESSIGVATYVPQRFAYAFYSFPGKVIEYMAKGLPVILTRATSIWREVENNQAGICIDYDVREFVSAVEMLFENGVQLNASRNRAITLASRYRFRDLLPSAFCKTLFAS